MKTIITLFWIVLAGLLISCEQEERLYSGQDIAYFDKKGILRDEIADNNTRMTFRVVSPLAVKHDREYTITKRFGSTMEEGKDYNFPKGRKAVIKAGEYWADVDVDIVPESLSMRVDTLSFGLEARSGEVAQFDNQLQLIVSKRCEFDPVRYAGAYKHITRLFEYMPDHMVQLEVVREKDGSIAKDRILIKKPYGDKGGADIVVKLDYDLDPKKVTPVVEVQQAAEIQVNLPFGGQAVVPFYVHTTEQRSYPVYKKQPNKSYLFTCSGEFVIYMVAGVFLNQEDGSVLDGVVGKAGAEEIFRRLEPPYETPKNVSLEAMNVEVQALVGQVTYK